MSGSVVRIDFNYRKDMARFQGIEREQFPFAVALALTRTAVQAQKVVQRETHEKFHLHTEFIPRNIKVIPAKKKDLIRYGFAEAYVNTTDKIAFMTIQEKGGTKTPRGRALSLPSEGLGGNYKTATGKIKASMRPAALLAKADSKAKAKKGTAGGKPIPFVHNGMILVRLGPDRYPLKVLYKFESKARIKPRWEFEGTVRIVASNYFADNLKEAMKIAVATAKVGA